MTILYTTIGFAFGFALGVAFMFLRGMQHP
jgi:hypothetical protein